MTCKWAYATPDGFDDIIMSGEGEYLTGLWFQGSKGASVTEGEVAAQAALRLGKEKMSAQAVGGAVGANPISIIVPCHRVVGAKGRLTGYSGGIGNKAALLRLEGIEI